MNLAITSGKNKKEWFWKSHNNVIGEETQFKDEADFFNMGAIDWTAASVVFRNRGIGPLDQRFRIFGNIIGADIQSDENETLAILDSEISSLAWPNPSSAQFNFNLETQALGKKVTLSIFDISGKIVHQHVDLVAKNNYVWDASAMTPGFYFVKIDGENTSKRFKIIKQ